MNSRQGSPRRPENKLLVAKACSLFYLGYTQAQISATLGLSPNLVCRYLKQRSLLDPAKLDPKAEQTRARRLLLLEDDIARSMPEALEGDCKSARATIRAIKARCCLLGLGLK